MPTLFSPCVGAIAKVDACNNEKVFAVRFSGGGGASLNFTAPITGFALEQNGNFQFLHTVNDFIYVYSFGDRLGELVMSGVGFVKTCAGAESANLSNVFSFYQQNKLFKNGKMSITLGDLPDATFYAFLTGMRLELQDASTMIGQWSMRFNVASKKK